MGGSESKPATPVTAASGVSCYGIKAKRQFSQVLIWHCAGESSIDSTVGCPVTSCVRNQCESFAGLHHWAFGAQRVGILYKSKRQRNLACKPFIAHFATAQAHLEGQEAAKKQMEKIIPSQVETMLEDKLVQAESGKAMALSEAIRAAEGRLRRAPIRDAPCKAERQQVAACYKSQSNALKCQDVVAAFASCAAQSADHLLDER
jgi:hypothetical protein